MMGTLALAGLSAAALTQPSARVAAQRGQRHLIHRRPKVRHRDERKLGIRDVIPEHRIHFGGHTVFGNRLLLGYRLGDHSEIEDLRRQLTEASAAPRFSGWLPPAR